MKSGEHKTVQARILEYAKAIGWTVVSREEAERRSGEFWRQFTYFPVKIVKSMLGALSKYH